MIMGMNAIGVDGVLSELKSEIKASEVMRRYEYEKNIF